MRGYLGGVFIVLITLGTAFFLFAQTPEAFLKDSSDGRARLFGSVGQETDVEIVPATDLSGDFTAAVLPAYRFYPGNIHLNQPVSFLIDFSNDTSLMPTKGLDLIGWYDANLGMWRTLPTEVDFENETATALISDFGQLYSLLALDDIGRPDFSSEMGMLLAGAPKEAVGYEIIVGYADQGTDFVELAGMGKAGGCSGQFQTGADTSIASVDRVFGDELTYTIKIRWQLGDGCYGREEIE